VSYTNGWNIGRTGGGSATISGLQFGLVGLSPTASLEDSTWDSVSHACSCTSWTTGTAIVCNMRVSRAGIVREVVTVGGAVGTRTQKFTFDGAHAMQCHAMHLDRLSTALMPTGQSTFFSRGPPCVLITLWCKAA
jgi:hypothetical protein